MAKGKALADADAGAGATMVCTSDFALRLNTTVITTTVDSCTTGMGEDVVETTVVTSTSSSSSRSETTGGLLKFLDLVVARGVAAAIRAFRCHLSDRTLQRIRARFKQAQSDIRTALFSLCKPPDSPAGASRTPEAQVLAHLRAVFPEAACPVAEFQYATRTFFL